MATIEGIELDITNREFNFASEFVLHTNKLVYLTGKAGTGKTTFLKYIKESSNKNMAILAPTGVAAINARGQTIHSFFQIKPSVYVPNDMRLRTKYNPDDIDKSTIYDKFQYNKNKLSIIKGLELLIIDEISMVRCDLLDVVDRLLRVFRKREHEAFGGVQVVLIGDTFQLPPIAQEPEWEILKQFYKNPFFFSSKVIEENKPIYIELKKIYRQKEQDFIDLLNRVRVNQVTQNDIDRLNVKFDPVFVPHKNENHIILATHNNIVKRTNLTKLEELPSELKLFEATVTGDFPAMNMPTDKILQLKENAQIMFVKNDKGKRYFNGKIAKIVKIDEDGIVAELSEENQILVERETWENIRFVWNDTKKRVEEEVVGTFTQYPIKLAWAITVHKSQGLTFEKVIADLNSAFAPGQVYVALSRCTTFNGLIFRTQLHKYAIKTDPDVLEFAKNEMPDTLIINELNSGKADFYYKQVRENLAKSDFEVAYDNLLKAIKYRNDIETEEFKRYFVAVAKRLASNKRILKEDVKKVKETIKISDAYWLHASKSFKNKGEFSFIEYENCDFLISSKKSGFSFTYDFFVKFNANTTHFDEETCINNSYRYRGVIEKTQNIAIITKEHHVYIFSIDSKKTLHTLDLDEGTDAYTCALVFSNDGSKLFTASKNIIKIWDTKSWKHTNILKIPDKLVINLSITNDNRFLYIETGNDEGSYYDVEQIIKWDLYDCEEVAVLNDGNSITHKLFINDVLNDTLLNSENFKKNIKDFSGNVIITEDRKLIIIYNWSHANYGTSFSYDKNGEIIEDDETIWILNSETLEILTSLDHIGSICSLSVSKDNNFLAAGGNSGRISIWYLPKFELIKTIQTRTGQIQSLSFSNNNEYLLSAVCETFEDCDSEYYYTTVECWSLAMIDDRLLPF